MIKCFVGSPLPFTPVCDDACNSQIVTKVCSSERRAVGLLWNGLVGLSPKFRLQQVRQPMPLTLLPIHVSRAGMGDSCCSMGSIGSIGRLLEDELGVYVYSIATGEGEYKDIWSSFYGRNTSCTLTIF